MFSRAEGESLRRQFFESHGKVWLVTSDVDNLSLLNLIQGKGIVNHPLADIQHARLEGINAPEIRRLVKGTINIQEGGDESSTLLDGNLTPDQVNALWRTCA